MTYKLSPTKKRCSIESKKGRIAKDRTPRRKDILQGPKWLPISF